MSFADACLVRMNELIPGSSLLTLDSDFRIYRKNKTQIIDVIIPDELQVQQLALSYQLLKFFWLSNQDLRTRHEKVGFEIASLSVAMTEIRSTA